MARPQPRVFKEEELQKFDEAAAKQSSKTRVPLTVDEERFPMFDIPVNGKKLVYVPNFTKTDIIDGVEVKDIICDRGAYHGVRFRGSFQDYRCNSEITGIEGFDGTCPMCEAMAENWDWYNIQYADVARTKGLDINKDEDKDKLADDRKDLLKNMAISNKVIKLTFPLVVIESTETMVGNKPVLKPVLDENNQLKLRVEWYRISEDTYNDKWSAAVQALPTGEQHPGGKFFILDYTYTPKNGKPTKMQSASNLKVIYKDMGANYEPLKPELDKLAADFTPTQAKKTIYSNMIYDNAGLGEVTAEVMARTREMLALHSVAKSGNVGIGVSESATSPEGIAQSFSATPSVGQNVGVSQN